MAEGRIAVARRGQLWLRGGGSARRGKVGLRERPEGAVEQVRWPRWGLPGVSFALSHHR